MDRSWRRGSLVIFIALGAMAAIMLAPKDHKRSVQAPKTDPWVLVSYDPDNQAGTYLGNGYISARIMSDGVGSQKTQHDRHFSNHSILPCFVAGLYENEKIIPVHTWSDVQFFDGKTPFTIDRKADYSQVLNLKTGILTTNATWRAGKKTLKGKIQIIVSRAKPHAALIKVSVTPSFSGDLMCKYFPAPKGYRNGIGEDQRGVYAYKAGSTGLYVGVGRASIMKSASEEPFVLFGPFMANTIKLQNNTPSSMDIFTTIFVGADVEQVSRDASKELKTLVFDGPGDKADRFVAEHKEAWAELWKRRIVIDGPRKDQQAINSCMFYLLQSVREGNQWSIPPMGLSADSFSGHVFWDADIWMFPALLLQHPQLARGIVDYRYNTLPGAMANAREHGYAGAEYAWESGATGREDTPSGLLYSDERHINGDVTLAQWQYFLATGDLSWLKTRGFPVIRATADYWVSRVVENNGRYEIRQIVPPDENAELVDNNAYTNAIAKMNLEIATRAANLTGQAANPKWATVADKIYIPFDDKAGRFVAHDNDKGQMAKQADTELLAYPLQFVLPGRDMDQIYRNTLDYYAPKVSPKGPAMTHSAHAVILARLGDCDKAYKALDRCYKPYLRGGLNYFNETASEVRTNYCFLTGCAGPIQSVLFGLAGANIDYFPADPSTAELRFNPCIPRQWRSITITGVQWQGRKYDISIDHNNNVTKTPASR